MADSRIPEAWEGRLVEALVLTGEHPYAIGKVFAERSSIMVWTMRRRLESVHEHGVLARLTTTFLPTEEAEAEELLEQECVSPAFYPWGALLLIWPLYTPL